MTQPITFTSTTGRFALPFLFAGQAQKEFFVNEALARVDTLLHPVVAGETDTPPQNPADGDLWLVAAGAQGDWTGHDGDMASYQAGEWTFIVPREGIWLFLASERRFVSYAGGWQRAESPTTPTDGSVVDTELRSSFEQLVASLRSLGLLG